MEFTVDDRVPPGGWHYLMQMNDLAMIVKCPGNEYIANRHLKLVRNDFFRNSQDHPVGPCPRLIGVYPPWTIGGPEGKGGVFSYGYTPTHTGDINTPLEFTPCS